MDITATVGPQEMVNKAKLRVKLLPKDERARGIGDILEELRGKLNRVAGLGYVMREAGMGGDGEDAVVGAPVSLQIRGTDYVTLRVVAQKAYDVVASTSGTRDLAMSYKPGPPEQHLTINRSRIADLGVSFASAATTLRTAVEGDAVAHYQDGERTVDVRVQLRPEDRDSLKEVLDIGVPDRRGGNVALRDITQLSSAATPATIERINRQRLINIGAGIQNRTLGEVTSDIEKGLAKIDLPPGTSFKFAGQAQQMQDSFKNLGIALLLAILFIYFVLASQFESFVHPFTIMMALPLAIVGALAFLFLFNIPLGMPALIGIILLMGLVTKNGILLVDYANQMRDKGMDILQALRVAGPARLRPILMTSMAMILGMIPTAGSGGEGSEFRRPMSIAVIGGVLTSTLLTLVVVPVIYIWLDRFTLRHRREKRAQRAQPDATQTKLVAVPPAA